MPVEIKVLEPDEFQMLKQVPDGVEVSPEQAIAIVALEGEEVVGRMLLVSMCHIEGTWVREGHRGKGILLKMSSEMTKKCESIGAKGLLTFVETPEFDKYLVRQGFRKLPWAVWGKEF